MSSQSVKAKTAADRSALLRLATRKSSNVLRIHTENLNPPPRRSRRVNGVSINIPADMSVENDGSGFDIIKYRGVTIRTSDDGAPFWVENDECATLDEARKIIDGKNLVKPEPTAPIHGRDLGFLIRDMIADRAFETFSHCALNGHYTSNGASRVTRVDSHDPNNLKIEIENGQKFTVRIFAS